MARTNRNDRAQEALDSLTAKLIDAMETDPGAWTQPWRGTLPANGVTGRRYNGSNILLLGLIAGERGYASSRWATYKQWSDAGCHVRKGEKSSVVVFYKNLQVPDPTVEDPEATKRIPLLRYSSVFAAEQVEGEHAAKLCAPVPAFDADERAERFFADVGAVVRHGGDSAYFSKQSDAITLPPRSAFEAPAAYYSVVAHEHIHWTGGPARLDRIAHKRFGDDEYAREELVAELGSVFVMSHLQLAHEPDRRQAAYLAHWSAHLRRKPRDLWSVVADASAALDHLVQRAQAAHEQEAA
jgi:antirestriction protein ArdC